MSSLQKVCFLSFFLDVRGKDFWYLNDLLKKISLRHKIINKYKAGHFFKGKFAYSNSYDTVFKYNENLIKKKTKTLIAYESFAKKIHINAVFIKSFFIESRVLGSYYLNFRKESVVNEISKLTLKSTRNMHMMLYCWGLSFRIWYQINIMKCLIFIDKMYYDFTIQEC